MPPQILREPMRASEHLVSEVTTQSREAAVITGGSFRAGTVMGRITASGKMTRLNPAGADGSQTAAGVLWGPVDASASDQPGTVNVRLTEVNGLCLIWPPGITQAQQSAAILQLQGIGVIVRT